MKNYVVISQKTSDGVFATLHTTNVLDVFSTSTLAVLMENSAEYTTPECMEENKLYVLGADSIDDDFESKIRALGFRKCDICGAWVTPQDCRNGNSTYDRYSNIRKCAKCLAAEEQRAAATRKITCGGYHSTGNFKVWTPDAMLDILPDGKYVGIEMECNGAHCKVSNQGLHTSFKATEEFYAIANNRSRHQVFHCEEDCTVAAEFISNCFTKQSYKQFNWDILTDQLKKLGNDEHYAKVGFHIHLSKSLLGNTDQEQALNFLKLQFVLNKYENDWFKFSGRNSRAEMQYCSFWSLDQIENIKRNVLAHPENAWMYFPGSHGDALIRSRNTIELRICHSTNDSERIVRTIELVWELVENIKNVRWEKLWCLGKLFKTVSSETMNYWRQKGCFLNTYAASERGMDAITLAPAAAAC